MNTQKLRELALGATQCKWFAIKNSSYHDITIENNHYSPIVAMVIGAPDLYGKTTEKDNAAYIAAACPANILALIDSRDALLAAIEDVIGFIPEHRQRALRSAITKAEAL